MKAKTYLRVAKSSGSKGFRVQAATRPNEEPITDSYGNALPTVAFAVVLDIPDELFKQAERVVAELNIEADSVRIAGTVAVPAET